MAQSSKLRGRRVGLFPILVSWFARAKRYVRGEGADGPTANLGWGLPANQSDGPGAFWLLWKTIVQFFPSCGAEPYEGGDEAGLQNHIRTTEGSPCEESRFACPS